MRPKKKILLVDPDENRRSVLRFVLRIWGYKVRAVSTPGGVERSARRYDIDLFVFQMSLPEIWLTAAVKEANWQHPFAKTVFLSEKLREFPDVAFDCTLLRASCNPMEIRERVKILAARRRGPRPALGKKPVASVGYVEMLAEIEAKRRVG